METVNINDMDITVKELNVIDAIECNMEILVSVGSILDQYKDWTKSTFELSIERPKLFYKLIATSTGKSKKFIKSLKAKDYDLLVLTFLSVNSEFFIQRLKIIQLSNNG